MKIQFLGTGAGDWPLKNTDNLLEFRRHASALIDGVLLIDPGPAVLDAIDEFKIEKDKIKYIINTHKHYDHYSADTVNALADSAQLIEFKANDTIKVGKYTINSFKANHSTCTDAVHFIVSDGKSNLFYGLDGAWLMYDEVEAIKKFKIDYAVLDGTVGFIDGDYRIFEHNNLNMVLEIQKTLIPYVKQFCISHMARTLHTNHKALSENMNKYNIDVAYDGYIREF